MDERGNRPGGLTRNASTAVIWPVVGMVGGLIVGGLRARSLAAFDIPDLERLIKWGVTGFFAGLGLALVLTLFQLRRRNVISIGRLMAMIAVVAVVICFFVRVFLGAIGYEGF